MSNRYHIGIAYNATNPPKPISLDVFDGDKWLAALSYEQVKDALRRFDEMLEKRATDAHSRSGSQDNAKAE